MEVRRLRPDEWRAFREIRLRALADSPDAFGATLDDASGRTDVEWQTRAEQSDGAIFVVDGADDFVAMASGGPAPNVPDTAAVFGMWVDPSARRRGLGGALIEAVKAWAIAEGYPRLGLGVTTTNAPAIALYERLGFVDTGDRYPLREGTDLVIQIMGMQLS
ncbi:MAG: GNAT family N-acetyltransferase [Candidatus Limnocylindrales bacterium]